MEFIRREHVLNIPNSLTLLRIALLPVVAWRFVCGDRIGALAVYLIAMLTDVLDGYLARKLNQITTAGKLLDPVADKLGLLTMLILFAWDGQIPGWLLALILAKESVLLLGGWIAFQQGIIVYALPIGKAATLVFILSMIARLLIMRRMADYLLGGFVVLSLAALLWYGAVLMDRISMKAHSEYAE